MSAFDPQPFIDDDGDQVGWVVPGEDGETYLVELDGTPAGVWDDAGQGWAVFEDDPETYEDPRFSEYEQRLAAMEYEAQQPREILVTRGQQQADADRVIEDLHRQSAHLEAALGRPLLIEERRRIASQVSDDIEAGDSRPDIFDAAHKAGGLLDLDDPHPGRAHEARTAFMAARLYDTQRLADQDQGLDDVSSPEPPPSQEFYDMDNRDDRLAYYDDRLRGVTDSSQGYSSSDHVEEWQQ